MYHNGISKDIGIRNTYSDIGQTVAQHLNLPKLANGIAVEL
jgi:phosphopentomutase